MRQGGHEEPLVVSGGCAAMLDFVQQLVSGVALGCVYGLIALGFVLVYKATEVVNFAQGDLMMLGGFFALTFIGMMGLNYWIGFAGAVAAVALFGMLAERVVVRPILDIFNSPPTKFSKTDHLANTITQVQQVKGGRWVLVKDNLMF
jgi:NhaP-type Na+/H+ or K+/H+ antiporter